MTGCGETSLFIIFSFFMVFGRWLVLSMLENLSHFLSVMLFQCRLPLSHTDSDVELSLCRALLSAAGLYLVCRPHAVK